MVFKYSAPSVPSVLKILLVNGITDGGGIKVVWSKCRASLTGCACPRSQLLPFSFPSGLELVLWGGQTNQYKEKLKHSPWATWPGGAELRKVIDVISVWNRFEVPVPFVPAKMLVT